MGSKRAIAESESVPMEEVYPDFNGRVALVAPGKERL